MTEQAVFNLGLGVWIAGAAVMAGWLSTVTRGNIGRRERMPRWRIAGTVLGFGALLLTVPQAKVLMWDWMYAWYLPAIVVFTALSYWKLDYLMARAVAGLLILAAYYFLYYSFALEAWQAPVGAVFSWIIGIAGICFAGKPCWMRDYLRFAAAHVWCRILSVLFLLATGIYALAVLVMEKA